MKEDGSGVKAGFVLPTKPPELGFPKPSSSS